MSEAIVPIVETETTEMSPKEKTELLLKALGHDEATTTVSRGDLLRVANGVEELGIVVIKRVDKNYMSLRIVEEKIKQQLGQSFSDTKSEEWLQDMADEIDLIKYESLLQLDGEVFEWHHLKFFLEMEEDLSLRLSQAEAQLLAFKDERADILEQIGKAVAAIDVWSPPRRTEPVPDYLIGEENHEATILPFQPRPTPITSEENLSTLSKIITEHHGDANDDSN